MLQDIIVYIIVAVAIASTIYRLVKTFRRKADDNAPCPNCGSRTHRCSDRQH